MTDNNVQQNEGLHDSTIADYLKVGFEKTKEFGSHAVETLQNPEFRHSVREKAEGAWESSKEIGSSAITTIKEAHIPQKIGDGLVVAKNKISEVKLSDSDSRKHWQSDYCNQRKDKPCYIDYTRSRIPRRCQGRCQEFILQSKRTQSASRWISY